jgi:hypothetical protein
MVGACVRGRNHMVRQEARDSKVRFILSLKIHSHVNSCHMETPSLNTSINPFLGRGLSDLDIFQ